MRYDIAIIGTGPAGVSAALTAKNRNKKFILIGSRTGSEKIRKTHRIVNYPGLPNVSGEALNQAFLGQLKDAGIEITEKRVANIFAMGDYFSLQVDQDFIEASTVILATGTSFGKPIPGENENLGRGVSYCATCDAPLYRGKETVVVGWDPKEEPEAAFLSETCSKVTYIPMYKGDGKLPGKVEVVTGVKPAFVGKADGKMRLSLVPLAKGTEAAVDHIDADCVFLLRESVAPDKLVPGLQLDGSHVKADRGMATNLPGFYVAGDLAGLPYQIAKATGEGNVAAISAAQYLDQKAREAAETV